MAIVSRARRPPTRPDPAPRGFWSDLAELLSLPLRWLSWAVLTRVITDHHDDPEAAGDAVVDVVDWDEANAPMAAAIAEAAIDPFGEGMRSVDPSMQPRDAIAWAEAFAAERVVDISAATKASIRQAVVDGLREGQSTDDVARRVQQSVGLHPQWARAVHRYRNGLRNRNVPYGRALQMTADYQRRLVERRAQNIARTETLTASSQGRLEGYREMAHNAGDVEMEKEWLTARESVSKGGRRVCAVCAPLNHRKVRGLNTLFVSGLVAVAVPPAHPSCRCSWIATPMAADRAPEPEEPEEPEELGPEPEPQEPTEPPPAVTEPATPQTGVAASSTLSTLPGERGEIGREVRYGLRAIERVHRVPEGMPPVPVKESSARSYFGSYEYERHTLTPVAIRIARHGDHKATTFAHEFGHYLDGQGGSRPGISSTSPVGRQDPAMAAFFDAVDASPTMRALRSYATTGRRGDGSSYYLQTSEIWARAYAQWIATRANDEKMLREVARIRTVQGARALSQWSPEEFTPIADTITAIFRERGLL